MKEKQDAIPRNERVRLVRIQTFFKNSAGNPLSFIMGGGLLFSAFYGSGVSDAVLFGWLALLIIASGLIFLFERHVRQVGLSHDNVQRFFRIRILLGGFACFLCGSTVGFLPDQAAGVVHVFAFIIASSVVTVSYMTYATAFSYGLTVNALTLLPFTVYFVSRFFVVGDSMFLLLGLTAVLWQAVVVSKAFKVSRSAIETIVASESLRDEIAQRELVEEALRNSKEQSQQLASMLRLMCDNVPDMIWAKDLEGRYTFVNKAFCDKFLGVENTEDPIGKTYEYFVERERDHHPENPEWHTFGQYSQDVERHALSREEPTVYEECGNVCGRFVFLDIHRARFVNSQGEVIGTVGCARDITERKASEDFVQHLAHHDVLTDLPNRILLTDRMRQALGQARRDRGKLAVLFIDLDRLKPVNDSFGHDVGDLLLKEVANRLRQVVTRESDTVSRLGGDEFVVLLQRINTDQDAATVAAMFLDAIRQNFTIGGHRIDISASIGIAVFPQHGDDAVQLLRNADSAMYAAKNGGRNRFRFFEAAMSR